MGRREILPLPELELGSIGHPARSQSLYRLRCPGFCSGYRAGINFLYQFWCIYNIFNKIEKCVLHNTFIKNYQLLLNLHEIGCSEFQISDNLQYRINKICGNVYGTRGRVVCGSINYFFL
jgi:hypothetical protein